MTATPEQLRELARQLRHTAAEVSHLDAEAASDLVVLARHLVERATATEQGRGDCTPDCAEFGCHDWTHRHHRP